MLWSVKKAVMEIGMPFYKRRRREYSNQIGHTPECDIVFVCGGRSKNSKTLSVECVGQDCGGSWFLRTDEQLIMVKSSKCPGSFSKSAGGLFTVTVYSDFTPNQRVDGRVSN